VVMMTVFDTELTMHERFDLKVHTLHSPCIHYTPHAYTTLPMHYALCTHYTPHAPCTMHTLHSPCTMHYAYTTLPMHHALCTHYTPHAPCTMHTLHSPCTMHYAHTTHSRALSRLGIGIQTDSGRGAAGEGEPRCVYL
jgi:hypothetical protein